MPSPSLTLRRPSPATASPEAIAAFVDAADSVPADPMPAPNTVPAPNPAPTTSRRATAVEQRRSSALPSISQHSPVPLRALSDEPSTSAPSFRRASRAVVHRRTKPARRRTTVYLDVDVATELASMLTVRDQELSDAVNAAVQAWLNANR